VVVVRLVAGGVRAGPGAEPGGGRTRGRVWVRASWVGGFVSVCLWPSLASQLRHRVQPPEGRTRHPMLTVRVAESLLPSQRLLRRIQPTAGATPTTLGRG
jgi:hypothetical protein